MNIFKQLKQDIIDILSHIVPAGFPTNNIAIEIPKDNTHGDLSTNAAMVLSKFAKQAPKALAEQIIAKTQEFDYIHSAEIAGPGFINFRLNNDVWHNTLENIEKNFDVFSAVNCGQNSKVNVEFVSANPTGPMHIGHARGAVYGDALAKLLSATGHNITKEYYINDAGGQISVLVQSALLRYEEAITGKEAVIPEGLYPGDYLKPAGAMLAEKYGDTILGKSFEDSFPIIRQEVIDSMMDLITSDLADLGIKYDVFFSEASLHNSDAVDTAINSLRAQDLIYEGILEQPKGKKDEEWEERSQTLFRSTNFGDDQDRALAKHDGAWTYFASDIAYAKDKIDRGFEHLILVLGADHGGYVKRLNAATHALSDGKVKSDVKLCQLVNFVENGQPIKMSKRAGNFTTVRDVINEMGSDIVRFMMLSRKNDAVLDFDLAKLKEKNKDNPVFYVQYAYARGCSVLEGATERMPQAVEILNSSQYDASLLQLPEEIALIKLLASWPKMLESAALHAEPHRIAFYLQQVAAEFHSMWNLGKLNNDYRFIIEDNAELSGARLALISAMLKVLEHGSQIIGITTPSKM